MLPSSHGPWLRACKPLGLWALGYGPEKARPCVWGDVRKGVVCFRFLLPTRYSHVPVALASLRHTAKPPEKGNKQAGRMGLSRIRSFFFSIRPSVQHFNTLGIWCGFGSVPFWWLQRSIFANSQALGRKSVGNAGRVGVYMGCVYVQRKG